MLYRASVYLLGILINFLGVALIINATLGAGFWTSFFIGVSEKLGYTVGFWYGTAQFIIIFINGRLMKQAPEFRAVLPVVLEAIVLDFWLEVVFGGLNLAGAPFVWQVLMLAAGVILVGLGVAIYILPQLPRAPVDQLFLAVSHRFNLSLRMGQTLIGIMMGTFAFLIGGPIGLGTIAPIIFLGPCIQLWYTNAYPIYEKYQPLAEELSPESSV
ncbi:YitT family protein [Thalassobacillus sp. CUG 92003]|uniref:YczE/YyaS/YitT family protein n=1 Tax=Thalassobacillus sp. CUG 92003 TaxID=2736641 RepID=UPI0015E752EF|nr:hypothetical protein [Thalassobacillus sp. CUG 92003]